MKARVKAGRCHQHTSYKGLAKPAVRMLNGFLTSYYGALNFSCYYGDSAPGGEAGGHRGIGHGECPAPLSGLGVFACTAGATSFCRAAAFAVFVRHKAEGVLSQPERRWLATSPRIREEVISESGLPQMPILGNLFAIAPVRRAKIAVRFYQQGWIPAMPLQVDGTRTTATARPQTKP